jgi:hypothetical protein
LEETFALVFSGGYLPVDGMWDKSRGCGLNTSVLVNRKIPTVFRRSWQVDRSPGRVQSICYLKIAVSWQSQVK